MSTLLTQWRQVLRDYCDTFAQRPLWLAQDTLLCIAAIAVVFLDLVAFAAIISGAGK